MTKELTKKQIQGLYDLYYNQNFVFGRDRLWKRANEDGLGLTQRQVGDWLRKQEVSQLFLRPKRERIVRSTVLTEPGKVLGIDLADLQLLEWDGYNYILTAIDLFSKKAYARPLKTKTQGEVAKAMREILIESHHKGAVRSDRGSEFINPTFRKVLDEFGNKQVLSLAGKPQSNGQVERFNATIKGLIRKAMITQRTRDWVRLLPVLVKNYNEARQETTKMTPNEAHTSTNTNIIYSRIKDNASAIAEPPKFNVGDTVRLRKTILDNTGTLWTKDLYTISKVLRPKKAFSSPIYRIEGKKGNYYEESLQKVGDTENEREIKPRYIISKILRRSTRKGEPGYIVKWKGYKDPGWVEEEILRQDIPKVLKAFNRKNGV